jgi:hypothetical protein
MNVCVCLFCVCVVLCVGSCLATGWSPVQGVLPTVYRLRNWKSGQDPQGLWRHKIEFDMFWRNVTYTIYS